MGLLIAFVATRIIRKPAEEEKANKIDEPLKAVNGGPFFKE